ncbi:MAG: acyltransferase [Pirellulales bacterium]
MTHELIRPQPAPARSGRIIELDALRGLAAVAVVLFHYTTRYQQLFGHSESLAASVPWGHYGVDLFFMLSGFVILMTLERTADGVKFAWGRFSRLYPTYWAAAALTFVVISITGLPGQEVTLAQALVNGTMLQGLLKVPHVDGAYWSLQAELIFYANMLLLYKLGAFRRPAATVVIWLAVACLVYVLREYTLTAWPLAESVLRKLATIGSLKFIPMFGIGILLYDAHRAGEYSRLTWVGLIACVATVGWWEGTSALAVDLSLALLLWMAISGRMSVLAAGPLVWLGAISYSLYLTHQNIGYVMIRNLEAQGVGPMFAITLAGVVALGIAICLHHWVERPTMRFCKRVDPAAVVRRFRREKLATANS